jgi:phage terminase large subunit GpA-like protein
MQSVKLSLAAATVLLAVAEALAPAPEMSISEWVDRGEVILSARTNTPRPGPFSFDGVEYIREPLDRLHPDDPCARVPVMGGAQTAKSSIGQLWTAWSIKNNPKSFAIGLPSDGEVGKYNDFKLQPIIEDSPELAPRVRPVSTKASEGSSVRKKKLFNGASILIFNLGSPKELQMISTGNLIIEEITGAPRDVGGRGSPVKQARERQAAYSIIGSKELMVSTPGAKGECEMSVAFEAGDQRHFYGACKHCDGHFALEPEGFKPASGSWAHHFICPGCGNPLFQEDRDHWRRNGVWIPTFVSLFPDDNPAPPAFIEAGEVMRWRERNCEGRQPSYYVWQAMSGFVSFDKIANDIASAHTPEEKKALEQQTFGRAYDPAVEALDWEELHKLREPYEQDVVPSAAGVVTAFTDVQGSWLQTTVFAWGPGGEWWVVARYTITGDTSSNEVWQKLDELTRKTYRHADGGELPIAAFGVDTGFRTQRVYSFCRGRHNCFALDGRPDWKTPYIGRPKPQKIVENGRVRGRVKLYPTGTWQLKALLSWSLKISIEHGYQVPAQGRGHWSMAEDEEWCRQITAEVLHEEENAKTGQTDRWWKKARPRNEETDIWVGSRALAWMLGVGAPAKDGTGERFDWTAAKANRIGAPKQSELLVIAAAPAASSPPPQAPRASSRPWF